MQRLRQTLVLPASTGALLGLLLLSGGVYGQSTGSGNGGGVSGPSAGSRTGKPNAQGPVGNPRGAEGGARSGGGLTLERIEQGVSDVNPLRTSLRQMQVDLRVPTGFEQVYRLNSVSGTDRDQFARINGAVTAVFPRSSYVANKRGILPSIPANTTFYIGRLPTLSQSGQPVNADGTYGRTDNSSGAVRVNSIAEYSNFDDQSATTLMSASPAMRRDGTIVTDDARDGGNGQASRPRNRSTIVPPRRSNATANRQDLADHSGPYLGPESRTATDLSPSEHAQSPTASIAVEVPADGLVHAQQPLESSTELLPSNSRVFGSELARQQRLRSLMLQAASGERSRQLNETH